VVLEDSVESNPPRVASLVAAGIKARLDSPARYTHAKLVVVDGQQALLGSTNGSWSSLRRNNEANVLAADARLAGWFERYAQAVFASPEQAPGLVPITTPLGRTLHDGDYLGRAQLLIDGAQRRIDVVTYAMNADPRYPDSDVNQLVRRLGAARRRGVKVQVLLEQSAPDLGVNAINQQAAAALRGEGLDVRFDPPGTITHAKVLRVDDEVIVGSNNWGYGGFRTYHEVGVQTRAPEVVAALGRYLDALWAAGSEVQ
jgi:phosphatidylserine/phosphatidylglycerophosphate/cardiolipin synthase-like enzyme